MKPAHRTPRALWAVVIVLAAIGIAAVLRRISLLIPVLTGAPPPSGHSVLDEINTGFSAHPILTLIHIVPGLVFLLLAPFQFSRLRTASPRFHRWSGRIAVAAAVVVGLSALAMSFKVPIGGATETAATTTFAIYFLIAIGKAFVHIRRRQIAQHREWMIRAFAIGLAIATIRPINGIFFALYFSRHFLTPHEFFGIAFWLGFILHAAAAELWIRHTRYAGQTNF